MANNCITEIYIELNNKFDKETMFEKLDKIVCESNKEDKGAFFGSKERYFFEGEVADLSENEISVVGWVKWCLKNNEVIKFFKFFNDIAFIEKMTIKCFEIGCGICEKYVYDCKDEKTIMHYWLNEGIVFDYNSKDEDGTVYEDCFDELENNSENEVIEIA